MDRDNIYKQHILETIARIEKYLIGVSQETFLDDDLLRAAVTRELEIIGEASKRLSDTFKRQYADIPWKKIAGFRDVAIHDYILVDYDIVWTITKQDIPTLKEVLKK